VDDEFLKKLDAALARGVKVWIAYGLSAQGGRDGDREQSPDWRDAEAGLARLRKKYPEAFQLQDLGNTHEKIQSGRPLFQTMSSGDSPPDAARRCNSAAVTGPWRTPARE
jgi:hypothetical protein